MTVRSPIALEIIDDAVDAVASYHERISRAYNDIVVTEASEFNQTIEYLDRRFPEHADEFQFFALNKEHILIESKSQFPYVSEVELEHYFASSYAVDREMFELVYQSRDHRKLADIWLYVEAMELLRQEREKKTAILQVRYISYSSRLLRAKVMHENSPRETGSAILLALDLMTDIEKDTGV